MLSSIRSPALYMQAAFRSQNPCLFKDGHECFRKENAYVFDFDPARTLIIFEEFANDLSSDTSGGRGDSQTREAHIRELLNFFPVIGEDENGEMVELDAAQVLSIPRKIKSKEVVRRGFMSDFLFQNISNVFRAPAEVIEMIQKMAPAKDPGPLAGVTPETGDDLHMNEDGEIELPDEEVIGTAAGLFGDKIYNDEGLQGMIEDAVEQAAAQSADPQSDKERQQVEELKKMFHKDITDQIIETAAQKYGDDMSDRAQRKLKDKINASTDAAIECGIRPEAGRSRQELQGKDGGNLRHCHEGGRGDRRP